MRKLLLLLFTLFTLKAFGQTDTNNICKDTTHFFILVGGQITAGNFNSFGVNTSSEFKRKHNNNFWFVSPSFRLTMQRASQGKPYTYKELEFYSNQCYEKKYKDWKVIVFSEIEHSYLRKIKVRTDIGIGAGYQFIRNKNLILEVTEVALPDIYISDSSSRSNFTLRSSTRLKFALCFNPVTISSINLFQPELCGWDFKGKIIKQEENIDFRSTTMIDVMIKKGFSLGAKVDVIYQTYPHIISVELKSLPISSYDVITSIYLKWTI